MPAGRSLPLYKRSLPPYKPGGGPSRSWRPKKKTRRAIVRRIPHPPRTHLTVTGSRPEPLVRTHTIPQKLIEQRKAHTARYLARLKHQHEVKSRLKTRGRQRDIQSKQKHIRVLNAVHGKGIVNPTPPHLWHWDVAAFGGGDHSLSTIIANDVVPSLTCNLHGIIGGGTIWANIHGSRLYTGPASTFSVNITNYVFGGAFPIICIIAFQLKQDGVLIFDSGPFGLPLQAPQVVSAPIAAGVSSLLEFQGCLGGTIPVMTDALGLASANFTDITLNLTF